MYIWGEGSGRGSGRVRDFCRQSRVGSGQRWVNVLATRVQEKWPVDNSDLTSIDSISLSRTVFPDIWLQSFPGFDVNLWPLEDIWGLTFFCHSKSHTWLPICVLLTLYLYRTVFEIFEFKKSRVRPWPLTSRSHLMSNIFLQFESSYMTV